ncbi:MAG: thiamine diphosphokinase [Trueperaceae bacterium]
MKTVILAGGELRPTNHLKQLISDAGLVLAADSGLRHARALGLQPAAIVGDFDSVEQRHLAAYPNLPRFEHPADKDQLDLELTVDLALERGATELVIVGAFGSRLDQSLACLMIAARLRRDLMIPVSLHDGERDAYPLAAGNTLLLDLQTGTVFSLLALIDSRCSVSGARYNLTNAPLAFGVGLGLANRARNGPRVEVHEGLVAVIVERTLGTSEVSLSARP